MPPPRSEDEVESLTITQAMPRKNKTSTTALRKIQEENPLEDRVAIWYWRFQTAMD